MIENYINKIDFLLNIHLIGLYDSLSKLYYIIIHNKHYNIIYNTNYFHFYQIILNYINNQYYLI